MTKRSPKDQQRERLVSYKFEQLRTKIESRFQKKLRKKQNELSKKGMLYSGPGLSAIRNIQIQMIQKLAEELAAIDKEVYGDPTNEADVSSIIDRVKIFVDASIASLIRQETKRKEVPRRYLENVTGQIRRSREGILSNIRQNFLIFIMSEKLSPAKQKSIKIFVIMPFSKTTKQHPKKYWDKFFKRVRNIIRKQNYEAIKKWFDCSDITIKRAAAPQGNIVRSILRELKKSDIVIAVLTDRNPNVFYELGVRHTQSNKTIMLCQNSQKIPFDLKNYGVGLYDDGKRRYKHIEQELLERLKQIALNPANSDNPFYDFVLKS